MPIVVCVCVCVFSLQPNPHFPSPFDFSPCIPRNRRNILISRAIVANKTHYMESITEIEPPHISQGHISQGHTATGQSRIDPRPLRLSGVTGFRSGRTTTGWPTGCLGHSGGHRTHSYRIHRRLWANRQGGWRAGVTSRAPLEHRPHDGRVVLDYLQSLLQRAAPMAKPWVRFHSTGGRCRCTGERTTSDRRTWCLRPENGCRASPSGVCGRRSARHCRDEDSATG